MDKDKEIVSQESKLISTNVDGDSNKGLHEVFTKMSELLQTAVVSLQLQNVREADMAARTAEGLYDDASKREASSDQLLLLKIFTNLISLYPPLTRALVFQMEGRFARAREELAKGLTTCDNGITNLDEYARLPNADGQALQIFSPIFLIFPVLFRGADASIRAEIVGYQGNIPHYRELLREAVIEYRKAERLPPNLNPMVLALINFCASLAERLETRIDVFSSVQGQRYLSPTGKKIFIIHGHDEAKWRELRELLEDQLNQEIIVLKEEPGVGETLIKKFEEFADDCCYAFALFTPDDFIEKEGKNYSQARPNVLFELGWFYGRFGRDRVCIIKKAKTEIPSDLAGILSIDFHDDVSEGFMKIQAELRRVGLVAGDGRQLTRRLNARTKPVLGKKF